MHHHDVDRFVRNLPFSALCDDMLTMLVCATRWLPVHLYTLAYMSMHETCLLVCCPCFNTMKLWTSNPNLHLSLVDTTFCLFSCLLPFCLFACFIVSLIAMPIMLICFIPFHMLFASLLSIACLLVSCLCLYGARTLGARAQSPKCKQKRHRCKHMVKPSDSVQ